MELAVRLAAGGVCAALLAQLLRRHNAEIALCLAIVGCAAVLAAALGLMDGVGEALARARELSGLSGALLAPVMKCAAIGVVCRLAADECRDAGSGALGSAVELAGAVAALWTALPLLTALLDTVESILGG